MSKQLQIQPEQKPRFQTQIDYVFDIQKDGTTIEGESETEPGHALTPEHLFNMFVAGKLPNPSEGYFNDEDADFDSPDILKTVQADLIERIGQRQALEGTIAQLEKQLEDEKKIEEQKKKDSQPEPQPQ